MLARPAAPFVLALLCAWACAPKRAPERPRQPAISSTARRIELVVADGSCWGSGRVGHEIAVTPSRASLDGAPRSREWWDAMRARLNASIEAAPRPDHSRREPCRTGANYHCSFWLRVDGRPMSAGCCSLGSAFDELRRDARR